MSAASGYFWSHGHRAKHVAGETGLTGAHSPEGTLDPWSGSALPAAEVVQEAFEALKDRWN